MSEYLQHGLHPDADMLNSFVEGMLPEHERMACLQHLAECAACREVVFLTQEPLALEPPPAERAAWWKRWLKPIPVLCAAAVAGIAILSIALYHPNKPAATAPVATVAINAPEAANEPPARASLPVMRALEVPHVTTQRAAPKAAPQLAAPPISPQPAPAQVLLRPKDSLAPPQTSGFLQAAAAPAPASAAVPAAPATAQSAIAGTITDPSGAAISNATVTVLQASGAPGAAALSDKSGQFFIAGLAPGKYELQVRSAGFQQATKEIEVQKDQITRADSSLILGTTNETVEVATSSPIARSTSGLARVPLIGRMAAKKSAPAAGGSVSLPSGLAAVATASKGKVMLAADSAGTLYLSDNAGGKWKAIKAVWQGKVVELSADPPVSEGPAFRLTTDAGAAWYSRDGSHWYMAPIPH